LKWYEIDTNWYGIWILQKLGLVWDVKRVRLSEIQQGLVAAPNGKLIAPGAEESWATSGD